MIRKLIARIRRDWNDAPTENIFSDFDDVGATGDLDLFAAELGL